jgi:hypothetical protein
VATPILERHTLSGALGDILLDIRGGGGRAPRPAVIILRGFSRLEERLARAGFTAVSLNPSHPGFSGELADVESVLAALDRGELGVPRPTSIAIVGHGVGSPAEVAAAAERVRIPWLRLPGTGDDLDETTAWLIRHLP